MVLDKYATINLNKVFDRWEEDGSICYSEINDILSDLPKTKRIQTWLPSGDDFREYIKGQGVEPDGAGKASINLAVFLNTMEHFAENSSSTAPTSTRKPDDKKEKAFDGQKSIKTELESKDANLEDLSDQSLLVGLSATKEGIEKRRLERLKQLKQEELERDQYMKEQTERRARYQRMVEEENGIPNKTLNLIEEEEEDQVPQQDGSIIEDTSLDIGDTSSSYQHELQDDHSEHGGASPALTVPNWTRLEDTGWKPEQTTQYEDENSSTTDALEAIDNPSSIDQSNQMKKQTDENKKDNTAEAEKLNKSSEQDDGASQSDAYSNSHGNEIGHQLDSCKGKEQMDLASKNGAESGIENTERLESVVEEENEDLESVKNEILEPDSDYEEDYEFDDVDFVKHDKPVIEQKFDAASSIDYGEEIRTKHESKLERLQHEKSQLVSEESNSQSFQKQNDTNVTTANLKDSRHTYESESDTMNKLTEVDEPSESKIASKVTWDRGIADESDHELEMDQILQSTEEILQPDDLSEDEEEDVYCISDDDDEEEEAAEIRVEEIQKDSRALKSDGTGDVVSLRRDSELSSGSVVEPKSNVLEDEMSSVSLDEGEVKATPTGGWWDTSDEAEDLDVKEESDDRDDKTSSVQSKSKAQDKQKITKDSTTDISSFHDPHDDDDSSSSTTSDTESESLRNSTSIPNNVRTNDSTPKAKPGKKRRSFKAFHKNSSHDSDGEWIKVQQLSGRTDFESYVEYFNLYQSSCKALSNAKNLLQECRVENEVLQGMLIDTREDLSRTRHKATRYKTKVQELTAELEKLKNNVNPQFQPGEDTSSNKHGDYTRDWKIVHGSLNRPLHNENKNPEVDHGALHIVKICGMKLTTNGSPIKLPGRIFCEAEFDGQKRKTSVVRCNGSGTWAKWHDTITFDTSRCGESSLIAEPVTFAFRGKTLLKQPLFGTCQCFLLNENSAERQEELNFKVNLKLKENETQVGQGDVTVHFGVSLVYLQV